MSLHLEDNVQTTPLDNGAALKGMYLTFCVAAEIYALELCHVSEIVGLQKTTWVPDQPQALKGVINLRDQVIPVMDMRERFSVPPKESDIYTSIVVLEIAGRKTGLIVDRVKEVLEIPEDRLEPAPEIVQATTGRFIQGLGKIGDDVAILLDAPELTSF